MMNGIPPVPVTPETEVYWRGLKERKLLAQRCERGHVRHPARLVCPECWSREWSWTQLSGRATVETFLWYLADLGPVPEGIKQTPPYNVAVVALAEGPRLTANVLEVDFGQLAVGMELGARFEDIDDEWAALRFVPLDTPAE